MSASIDFTSAAGFRAFMEKFSPDLLYKLFHGFPTAGLITPHEGVKGKLVLTEYIIGSIVRRWAKSFDAVANAMDFVPRELVVAEAKVDLEVYPQEFEQTYLAMARRPGFNHQELPFEAFVLQRIIAKINEEQEKAVWQGDAAAVPAQTDNLSELFDGFLKLIADLITATTISPVTTGAISATNAVASLEAMYDALDEAYKEGATRVDVFCSSTIKQYYLRDYRTRYGYGLMTDKGTGSVRLDFGEVYLNAVPGMAGSGRVVMTPANNLHYGYDSAMDASVLKLQQIYRSLAIMSDFKLGVQIGLAQDGVLVVNDQT